MFYSLSSVKNRLSATEVHIRRGEIGSARAVPRSSQRPALEPYQEDGSTLGSVLNDGSLDRLHQGANAGNPATKRRFEDAKCGLGTLDWAARALHRAHDIEVSLMASHAIPLSWPGSFLPLSIAFSAPTACS